MLMEEPAVPRPAVPQVPLTPQQEAEAARLTEVVRAKVLEEAAAMCRLLASKPDSQLFGQTEFDLRDAALRIAGLAMQAVLDARQKKPARPSPARNAGRRRSSSPTAAGR
jgi:hypothetical protein